MRQHLPSFLLLLLLFSPIHASHSPPLPRTCSSFLPLFQHQVFATTGQYPSAVTLADLDRDGVSEVVVARSQGRVQVLKPDVVMELAPTGMLNSARAPVPFSSDAAMVDVDTSVSGSAEEWMDVRRVEVVPLYEGRGDGKAYVLVAGMYDNTRRHVQLYSTDGSSSTALDDSSRVVIVDGNGAVDGEYLRDTSLQVRFFDLDTDTYADLLMNDDVFGSLVWGNASTIPGNGNFAAFVNAPDRTLTVELSSGSDDGLYVATEVLLVDTDSTTAHSIVGLGVMERVHTHNVPTGFFIVKNEMSTRGTFTTTALFEPVFHDLPLLGHVHDLGSAMLNGDELADYFMYLDVVNTTDSSVQSRQLVWFAGLPGATVSPTFSVIEDDVPADVLPPLVADVDLDGDLDFVIADTTTFVWYENCRTSTQSSDCWVRHTIPDVLTDAMNSIQFLSGADTQFRHMLTESSVGFLYTSSVSRITGSGGELTLATVKAVLPQSLSPANESFVDAASTTSLEITLLPAAWEVESNMLAGDVTMCAEDITTNDGPTCESVTHLVTVIDADTTAISGVSLLDNRRYTLSFSAVAVCSSAQRAKLAPFTWVFSTYAFGVARFDPPVGSILPDGTNVTVHFSEPFVRNTSAPNEVTVENQDTGATSTVVQFQVDLETSVLPLAGESLVPGDVYQLQVPAGFFLDASTQAAAAAPWSASNEVYYLAELANPPALEVSSSTPADGATDVSSSIAELSVEFNLPVVRTNNAGARVRLLHVDDARFPRAEFTDDDDDFDVSIDRLSQTLTVDLGDGISLQPGGTYELTFDGFITSPYLEPMFSENNYMQHSIRFAVAGGSDPEVRRSIPADGSVFALPSLSSVVVFFSRRLVKTSDLTRVSITDLGSGAVVEEVTRVETGDGQLVNRRGDPAVLGYTQVIAPELSVPLEAGRAYKLELVDPAFEDLAGRTLATWSATFQVATTRPALSIQDTLRIPLTGSDPSPSALHSAFADLTGDGLGDVLLVTSDGALGYLPANRDGFGAFVSLLDEEDTVAGALDVAVGDVQANDGVAEVLVLFESSVRVFTIDKGTESFWDSTVVDTSAVSNANAVLAVGDFNGGLVDVVVGGAGGLVVMTNAADFADDFGQALDFDMSMFHTGHAVVAVCVADLDGEVDGGNILYVDSARQLHWLAMGTGAGDALEPVGSFNPFSYPLFQSLLFPASAVGAHSGTCFDMDSTTAPTGVAKPTIEVGAFVARPRIPAGVETDLTGRRDVFVHSGFGAVGVLLENEGGSQLSAIGVFCGGQGIGTFDLSGRGQADLVVASRTIDWVSADLFSAELARTAGPRSTVGGTNSAVVGLGAGNVDDAGSLDLVVVATHEIVWFGARQPTGSPVATASGMAITHATKVPARALPIDTDGDSATTPHLIVQYGEAVEIWEALALGELAPTSTEMVASGVASFAVGQLEREDEREDFVTVRLDGSAYVHRTKDGSIGSFAASTFKLPDEAPAGGPVEVVDWNDDGFNDIFCVSHDHRLHVWTYMSWDSFIERPNFELQTLSYDAPPLLSGGDAIGSMVLADLTANGVLDVLVPFGDVHVYERDQGSTNTLTRATLGTTDVGRVLALDADSDGLPDLIVVGDERVELHSNQGDLSFVFRQRLLHRAVVGASFDASNTQVIPMELNGDGVADVLLQARDVLYVLYNRGGSFEAAEAIGEVNVGVVLDTWPADWTGDSFLDVLVVSKLNSLELQVLPGVRHAGTRIARFTIDPTQAQDQCVRRVHFDYSCKSLTNMHDVQTAVQPARTEVSWAASGTFALSKPLVFRGDVLLSLPPGLSTIACDLGASAARPCITLHDKVRIAGGRLEVVGASDADQLWTLLRFDGDALEHDRLSGLVCRPSLAEVCSGRRAAIGARYPPPASVDESALLLRDHSSVLPGACFSMKNSRVAQLDTLSLEKCVVDEPDAGSLRSPAGAAGLWARNVGSIDAKRVLAQSCTSLRSGDSDSAAVYLEDVTTLATAVFSLMGNNATEAGALLAYNSSVRVTELHASGNRGTACGAMRFVDSSLSFAVQTTLDDTRTDMKWTCASNVASEGAGCLCVEDGAVSAERLAEVMIESNEGGAGGAMGLTDAQLDLTAASGATGRLDGNTASGRGGAIRGLRSHVSLERLSLVENRAAFGGALSTDDGDLRIETSTLEHNDAVQNGGAIECGGPGAQLVLARVQLSNSSAGAVGGAVWSDDCVAAFEDVTFSANEAQIGGAWYGSVGVERPAAPKRPVLTRVVFEGNSALDHGGAVAYQEHVSAVDLNATLSSFGTGVTFANNTAVQGGGGAVYWIPPDHYDVEPALGAVRRPVLTGAELVGNRAVYGTDLASRPVKIVLDEGSVETSEQESRGALRGSWVMRLYDGQDTLVTSALFATMVDLVVPNDVSLFGKRTSVESTAGVWNLTDVGLKVEGRPGTTVHVLAVPDVDWGMPAVNVSISLRACIAGEFIEDERRCLACPVGHAANATTGVADACPACGVGKFQSLAGQATCEECPIGKAVGVRGASTCVDCLPGRFAGERGLSECQLCDTGRFSNNTAATSCVACSPGRFGSTRGSQSCSLCAPGTEQPSGGQAVCEPCAENYAAVQPGTATCSFCSPPTFAASEGSAVCGRCGDNEYASFRNQSGSWSFLGCLSCPADAVCDPVTGQVTARTGFWLDLDPTSGAVTAYQCPESQCSDGQCEAGRKPAEENPRCAECEDGLREWNGECVECDKTRWDLVLLLFVGAFVLVMVVHRVAQTTTGELTVFMYFCQTALLVVGTEGNGFVVFLLELFNFRFTNATGSMCVTPLSALEQAYFPLVGPAMAFFIWGALYGLALLRHMFCPKELPLLDTGAPLRKKRKSRRQVMEERRKRRLASQRSGAPADAASSSSESEPVVDSEEERREALRRKYAGAPKDGSFDARPFFRTLIALYLFTFNAITQTTFEYFNCVEFTFRGETRSTLEAHPGVSCDSDSYQSLKQYFVLLATIEVGIVPLCLAFSLTHAWMNNLFRDARFARAWGMLFRVYKGERFMWELYTLMRRTALLFVFVYLADDRRSRYAVASLLNVVFLAVHLTLRPFASGNENFVEGVSLALLCFVTLAISMMSEPYSDAQNSVLFLLSMVPAALLFVWLFKNKVARACRKTGWWPDRDMQERRRRSLSRAAQRRSKRRLIRKRKKNGSVSRQSSRRSQRGGESVEMTGVRAIMPRSSSAVGGEGGPTRQSTGMSVYSSQPPPPAMTWQDYSRSKLALEQQSEDQMFQQEQLRVQLYSERDAHVSPDPDQQQLYDEFGSPGVQQSSGAGQQQFEEPPYWQQQYAQEQELQGQQQYVQEQFQQPQEQYVQEQQYQQQQQQQQQHYEQPHQQYEQPHQQYEQPHQQYEQHVTPDGGQRQLEPQYQPHQQYEQPPYDRMATPDGRQRQLEPQQPYQAASPEPVQQVQQVQQVQHQQQQHQHQQHAPASQPSRAQTFHQDQRQEAAQHDEPPRAQSYRRFDTSRGLNHAYASDDEDDAYM